MRRKEESIIIDNRIRITVIEIQTDQIRLKVEAPLGICDSKYLSGHFILYKDEAVDLNDDIRILLCNVLKSQCTLGISAPKDMVILREELTPIDQN